MNKKVLIGIVIAVVVLLLVIGMYFAFGNKGNASGNLDLKAVSENITRKEFEEMSTMDVDKETLSSYFQVDTANVDKVYGKVPMMNVHASLYLLVQAKDGKVDSVKEDLEDFGKSYEQEWSRYLPEQYDLVKDRKIGTKGNVVYLVIAEDADELVKLIK